MMSPLRGLALAAALLAPLPASAAILVEIDKSAQRMTVSQDGERLYTWPVSTGKRGHSTPSGQFKAFRMEKDHFSREWDDAPMPNSIFFTREGHAIHGSYDVKRIGTPASHGCVRLAPENAAVLFSLVKADGVLNTQVVLTGVEPAYTPNTPVARAPQNPNLAPQDNVARNVPNNSLDNQAYGGQTYGGDDRYPAPTYRYQQRAPIDDQRYANEETQPQQPAYRQPQPYYGRQYYPQQPQPYYGPRYRDPYYDNPPPPNYYRRGYGWN
jgi:L,D-transpeptidase catalytic domain